LVRRPRAWAFLRLMTSSYRVGCCTGRSASFVPAHDNLEPVCIGNVIEANVLPGIVAALGELKPGAVVTEEGDAHLFNRKTVKEAPPPQPLLYVPSHPARELDKELLVASIPKSIQ